MVLATTPAAWASSTGRVEATVRIVPITVSLTIEPSSAAIGAPIHARATVANGSASEAAIVSVELRFDPAGVLLKSDGRSTFTVRPGRSTSTGWTLCGRVAGSYVVLARAEVGGTFVDSPARLLTILAGPKSSCR
jgi:hypothetical protein